MLTIITTTSSTVATAKKHPNDLTIPTCQIPSLYLHPYSTDIGVLTQIHKIRFKQLNVSRLSNPTKYGPKIALSMPLYTTALFAFCYSATTPVAGVLKHMQHST